MEPIPETVRALNELDAITTDEAMLDALRDASEKVRAIVPACTGLSLAMIDHGVTLTLVVPQEQVGLSGASQHLGGGPVVATTTGHPVILGGEEAMDEERWQIFAAATAAHGVASTLAMPLIENGIVFGGVSVYAATSHAFDGHHEEIADVLGAWAGGAVANGDLAFSTRQVAQTAPQVLDDARHLDNALGMVAAHYTTSIEGARRRLDDAAVTAGLPVATVARAVVASRGHIDL